MSTTRRSHGTAARDYVLHIPRDFAAPRAAGLTVCGRSAATMNLVDKMPRRDDTTVCASCQKHTIRLESN